MSCRARAEPVPARFAYGLDRPVQTPPGESRGLFFSGRDRMHADPGLRREAEFGAAASAIAIGGNAADEFAEILGLAEIAIDRGKADIGDLVERRQRLHQDRKSTRLNS